MTPQKNNCRNCLLSGNESIIHLKSRFTIRYDISKASAPSMSSLKKDRKHVKILLKMPQK